MDGGALESISLSESKKKIHGLESERNAEVRRKGKGESYVGPFSKFI